MPPAARITDRTACPAVAPGPVPHVGGPIVTGAATVITGFRPQARIGDTAICVPPGIPDSIVRGSSNVFVNFRNAARLTDPMAHGGKIITGCPTVIIGEEVPPPERVGKPCLKRAAAAGSAFVEI